jgi:DNA-directed RNA polymerase specialized sigma24 family protein
MFCILLYSNERTFINSKKGGDLVDEDLRCKLYRLIKYKFATYPNVADLAEDIVHDAYVALRSSKAFRPEKENYGYLSVVCIRLAYRKFMTQAADIQQLSIDTEGTSLINQGDIVNEIIQAEDTHAVLESLKVLRDIERIVVTQRYYGDFSFTKIAEINGLKLNTTFYNSSAYTKPYIYIVKNRRNIHCRKSFERSRGLLRV